MNNNSIFLYIIFLFIGLNIKIFNGFYIYNLLIFLIIVMKYKHLLFNKKYFLLGMVFSTFLLSTILIQTFFIDEINTSNFYIFLNTIILVSLLLYIQTIDNYKLNYNILLLLISLPLFFTIMMFYNNSIENYLLSFYHIEKYPVFGRYGGVFGRDVNSLGLYASIVLLFTMVLRKYRVVFATVSVIIILISLYCIMLSGMRAGIIVFIGLLIVMHFKLHILNFKYMFIGLILLFVLFSYLYITNDEIQKLFDFIITRFSPEHFINDFNGDGNGNGGNLNQAINYFNTTIGDREINFYTLLFGVDSSLNYVDNFYIFLFLKHGLLSVLLFVFILMFIYYKAIKNKVYIVVYFIIATFLLALKGIFIMNNFYMFIVPFIILFWRKYENPNSR